MKTPKVTTFQSNITIFINHYVVINRKWTEWKQREIDIGIYGVELGADHRSTRHPATYNAKTDRTTTLVVSFIAMSFIVMQQQQHGLSAPLVAPVIPLQLKSYCQNGMNHNVEYWWEITRHGEWVKMNQYISVIFLWKKKRRLCSKLHMHVS